jgi:hypothetical protein
MLFFILHQWLVQNPQAYPSRLANFANSRDSNYYYNLASFAQVTEFSAIFLYPYALLKLVSTITHMSYKNKRCKLFRIRIFQLLAFKKEKRCFGLPAYRS